MIFMSHVRALCSQCVWRAGAHDGRGDAHPTGVGGQARFQQFLLRVGPHCGLRLFRTHRRCGSWDWLLGGTVKQCVWKSPKGPATHPIFPVALHSHEHEPHIKDNRLMTARWPWDVTQLPLTAPSWNLE